LRRQRLRILVTPKCRRCDRATKRFRADYLRWRGDHDYDRAITRLKAAAALTDNAFLQAQRDSMISAIESFKGAAMRILFASPGPTPRLR
jgi:hypothetical protein